MFDTYITPRPRTEYVTNRTEITENRAPTDESVRLLREMEKAADDKRIAVMKLDGNHFTGVVEVWKDLASLRIFARAIFDLNGKRCTATVDRPYSETHESKCELITALYEEISREVASEIIGSNIKALASGWRP